MDDKLTIRIPCFVSPKRLIMAFSYYFWRRRILQPCNLRAYYFSAKQKKLFFSNLSEFSSSSSHLLLLDDYESNNDTKPNQTFDPQSFFASAIERAVNIRYLNKTHSQLFKWGLQEDGFLITKLIIGFCDVGEVHYARQLFDEFPDPYLHLWNAIIRGYSKHYMFTDAISIYGRMQFLSVSPDCFTLPPLLKACSGLPSLQLGQIVHAHIFRHGFESDVFVQNGLVSLYTKCQRIKLARIVFDGLLNHKTIVSWTSMISGYAQNDQPLDAVKIFHEMRRMDVVNPDHVTLVSVLRAYADLEDLENGKSLHGFVIKTGFEFELDLKIGLTAMYAKCGQVMTAKSLFDQVELPNVILWNAMISGFAKNSYPEEAMKYFKRMIITSTIPDSITVRSAILACSQMGSLEQARWIDNYVMKLYKDDIFVRTGLIDMYAKCGNVELARNVFNSTIEKDVVVWTAMIVGYGLHGYGKEAIDLFQTMKRVGVRANDVTFIGLLTACNHAGLVNEGWRFFHSMKEEFGIEPRHQHYACVVDILGRAGFLDKAYEFISKMPIEPGVSVWGALLSGCKIYRYVELGEYAAEKLFAIDPVNTGHYVQLSNLYASARMWNGVGKIRVLMKEMGLEKDVGYSMIEIGGKLHAFRMGDKTHPKVKEIYKKLDFLERRLIEAEFCLFVVN
ncbi:pentatricopeptide repeat-containing protein At3g12770-like [Impatiens glandulifera]|uniref:pentatricopeptide repeat-containing protein At3g12770-like n=1 Tax=Impatiens glandulifera TaxID=253017 RepID=UPI001FB06486|nr:pentatricopeptide repeat-containing protein At3g12770-like [Impatiens glandulifera]